MRIKQLSAYLANQIAAGEVIERPASVLKELLENSLDAGADYIELDIEKGGLKRLRVTDNGSGIHKDDLLLAVGPHATSKLQTPEDLFNIHTLGFRGEALASISSVARLQLTSCQDSSAGAWQVSVAGGDEPQIMPTAHPVGTTVLVQDLFFNTPARRKFLRSDKTEFNQLEETFRRIVLSHYAVGFSFKHNQRQLYQLPAVQNDLAREKRIAKIFGSNFLQHALQIEFAISGMKLWGWIGEAQFTRSQADLQYIYLNGRIIRDKLVNHALRSAYEDKLYPGRYPLFLLYLEIEPSKVDVNVHPTKHEVRFHDSRLVHDFLYQGVREALANSAGQAKEIHSHNQAAENVNWSVSQMENLVYEPAQPSSLQIAERAEVAYETSKQTIIQPLGLLHNKYWLAEHPKGLLLVDVQQALFLLNQRMYLQPGTVAKPLLIPVTLKLTEQQIKTLESYQTILQELGVSLSVLSHNQILLRAVPNFPGKLNPSQFLHYLVKELMLISGEDCQMNNLVQSVAKAGSQAAQISPLDFQALVMQLAPFESKNNKVYTIIEPEMLAKMLR